ncbi:LacI family DNA-binding transcriptional regulator [Occultella gossypii]|uniref:LacI family DNA-binding transcriptional regulator n=1 Tax=Occultella gossypii TaxID=2800820 RepID=UPI001CBF11C0|nr:substrate-binding domain-containing protein [Occultella gossypii]
MTQGVGAVGFVLARPARMLGIEPFHMELIAGIEGRLSGEGHSLLLHVVPDLDAEIAAYRRWAEGKLVDAVIVTNLHRVDQRLEVLAEIDLPTVVVGGPRRDLPFTNIWIDNAQAMRDAVAYLASLGHTALARVSGPSGLAHTQARTEAFREECAARGLTGVVVEADYSEEGGARATRSLLGRAGAPSAVVYDNDVMALAGLGVAAELDVAVPRSLSILAWDDSTLCRLASPPLSVMSLDVYGMGALTADCVLNVLAGGPVLSHVAPQPHLVPRGSTAPPG